MNLTDYHAKCFAHELTRRCPSDSVEKFAAALADAQVDLNPHQVDAALFAFRSPLSKGALLADEVGLGKTIEAGLVLSQKWAERKRRILVITPSNLRKAGIHSSRNFGTQRPDLRGRDRETRGLGRRSQAGSGTRDQGTRPADQGGPSQRRHGFNAGIETRRAEVDQSAGGAAQQSAPFSLRCPGSGRSSAGGPDRQHRGQAHPEGGATGALLRSLDFGLASSSIDPRGYNRTNRSANQHPGKSSETRAH